MKPRGPLQRNRPHALFRAFGPKTHADAFTGVAQVEQVFRVQKCSDLHRSGQVKVSTWREWATRTMCSTSFGRSHNPHRGVEPTGPDSEGAPTSPNMFPLGWLVLIFFLGGISAPKEMKGGKQETGDAGKTRCVLLYSYAAAVAKPADNG